MKRYMALGYKTSSEWLELSINTKMFKISAMKDSFKYLKLGWTVKIIEIIKNV